MNSEMRRRSGRILERGNGLASLYTRAVREEKLDEVVELRIRLAEMVRETDRLLADAIADRLQERIDQG